MSATQLKAIGSVLLFAFIFLSGFGLSNSGRPFSVILLTIHKLIALGALVLVVVAAHQANQASGLGTPEIIAIVVTVLLFVSTILTGGLLSTDQPMPEIVWSLHRVLPFLTTATTAVSLYLLLDRR